MDIHYGYNVKYTFNLMFDLINYE